MSAATKTVITPECTLSFPALYEPRAAKPGETPMYSCQLVFAPGTDLKPLMSVAGATLVEKFGADAMEQVRLGKLKTPFRKDCESKGYPPGTIFMNCRSKMKPGLVGKHAGPDGKPEPISDPAKMYAGCKVRASVTAFAYEQKMNKGVSFSINNLQWLGDGPRLDGRRAAADEFDVIEETADDLL